MKDGDELIPMLKQLTSALTPDDEEGLANSCEHFLLEEYRSGRLAERVLDIVEMLYSTYKAITGLEAFDITCGKRPISWEADDPLRPRCCQNCNKRSINLFNGKIFCDVIREQEGCGKLHPLTDVCKHHKYFSWKD